MRKQWTDAEQRYAQVLAQYPDTASAAEALYWRAVCRYK
jgi:TolA-binding protein